MNYILPIIQTKGFKAEGRGKEKKKKKKRTRKKTVPLDRLNSIPVAASENLLINNHDQMAAGNT